MKKQNDTKSKFKRILKIIILVILILLTFFLFFSSIRILNLANNLNRPDAVYGSQIMLHLALFIFLLFMWILSTFFMIKKIKWIIRLCGVGLFLVSFLLIPFYINQFNKINERIRTREAIPGYSPHLLVQIGLEAWEEGKIDLAMRYFDEAIRTYEYSGNKFKDPDPYNMKAWIYATEVNSSYFNPKLAIENALIAVNITSWKDPTPIDTLATAYASAGDYKAAYETQLKAVKLEPDNKLYQDNLKKYNNLRKRS